MCDNTLAKLATIACEFFEVKNDLIYKIMENFISFKTFPCSLRNSITLQCKSTKTVFPAWETKFSLEINIWAFLPTKTRNIKSSDEFKKKIPDGLQIIVCIDYANIDCASVYLCVLLSVYVSMNKD